MSFVLRYCGTAGLLVVLATAGWAQQAPPAAAPFRWESDLEAGKSAALASNRLLLLHFGATWCQPCQRLEDQVFSHPTFGPAISQQYVAVKLNYDQNRKLADQFGLQYVPSDVILTPQGQLVQKLQSPPTLEQYLGVMQQIATHARPQATAVAAAAPTGVAPNNAAVPAGAPPSAAAPTAPATAPPMTTPPSDNRYADYYQQRQAAAAQTTAVAASYAPQQPAQQAPLAGTPVATAPIATAAAPTSPALPTNQPPAPPVAPAMAQAPTQGAPPPAAPAAANPVARPAVASNIQLPPGSPPLGLDGYCPVTLIEKRVWKLGDTRFGAIHRNRTYLFADQAEQQRFLANPDAYSPVMSGDDPVLAMDQNRAVAGTRKHGVFFGNRIYLFASEQTLGDFSRNPNRYAPEITQARR